MKKKTLTLMLLSAISFLNFSYGQNLVPNWSFEDTVSCPNNVNQLDKAAGWSSYRNSPDYFNTCADNASLVSIPYNFSGYHYPRTGNAYSGFIIGLGYREHLGIQLTQSLNIGEEYYVSFYVCRGSSVNRNRAANKIGVKLSTVSFSEAIPELITNNSQVYTDSVITDTLNWVRIAGSFIADSSYDYIGIGSFFSDSLTTYISFDSTHLQSYYYCDDIILSSDSNCCSDVNDISENEQIKIYPNPGHDWISVETKQASKISICDILGRFCLGENTFLSSNHKLNVSNLDEGIYFLSIEYSTKNILRKLIIE